MGTLNTDQYIFLFIPCSFLPESHNCFRQRCTENRTHNICSFRTRSVYEITWNDAVQPDRAQGKAWRTRIICQIPKATDTHSQYVPLTAFPQQQWLHERVSSLLYRLSTLPAIFLNTLFTYNVYIKSYLLHLQRFT